MNYERIFQKVWREPALILPSAHESLQSALLSHIDGKLGLPKEIKERTDSRFPSASSSSSGQTVSYYKTFGNIAVISQFGVIGKHLSWIETMCGGCDLNHLLHSVEEAIKDDRIESILLEVDSPGGSATGVYEFGLKLREFSKIKPIYSFTETQACSASYWTSACCSGVIATPSSVVGSIGVYMAWYADNNENLQLIQSGKYKAIGMRPLTDEEREIMQTRCDEIFETFRSQVEINRPQVGRESMEGQIFNGEQALEAGLVDTLVLTFDEALEVIRS